MPKYRQFTDWLPRNDPDLTRWIVHFRERKILHVVKEKKMRHRAIYRAVFVATNKTVAKRVNK